MPNVILIDIDDTILSFQAYVKEAMKSGFEKFSLGEYKEEMYGVFQKINSSLWHRLEKGELSFEELKKIRWNLIFQALGINFDGVKFEAYFRDCLFDSAIPEEGARELLSYLKEKYILCAASNGPYLQQLNRLEVGDMKPFFSHFFISEEVGYSKPSKEFFEISFQRLNEGRENPFSLEDILIIGDSISSDIKGGKDFGIKTIFYNRKREDLSGEIRPDYTVNSLYEIMNIL